jgi:hypothetical protein
MRTQLMLVPEERLGVVALSNGGEPSRLLTQAVAYRVLDLFFGGMPRDWSVELLAVRRDQVERDAADARRRELERVEGTEPSFRLDVYAGTYRSQLYGDVRVSLERGALALRFGPLVEGSLTHWHYDTFEARWRDPVRDPALITFVVDAKAAPSRLTWEELGEFLRVDSIAARPRR